MEYKSCVIFFFQAEDGIRDVAVDFRRIWDLLIDCGIVNLIKVNGKITATKIDVYDKEKIQSIHKRSELFNDFIVAFVDVVPDDVQVIEDGKETPKGIVEYIKGLQEENKKLKQQIEQDDLLFEDCQ